jgi:hypothetical protein
MNGWKLTRGVARTLVLVVIGVIAACAHAPPTQELSILDSLENHPLSRGPASCAEMNATAVCEKSTRLDGGHNCRCVDTKALTGAGAFRL